MAIRTLGEREELLRELARVAARVRYRVVEAIGRAGSGHPGGSLSVVDILVVLYFAHMRHTPTNPSWWARDRLVFSKGHGCPALYAVLAEAGYFDPEELATLRRFGSRLQGHPGMTGLPGLEVPAGSLGHGLSVGAGIALGLRLDSIPARVYVVLGDGELDEGQVWEAALFASHQRLSNLVAIVDANGFQLDGPTREILDTEPLLAKWEAFGWEGMEVDGHDHAALLEALEWAASSERAPRVIVARTVKGKGVSFMEGQGAWHGVAPKGEELEKALEELGRAMEVRGEGW